MDRDLRRVAVERGIALVHGVERSTRGKIAAIARPIDAWNHGADLSEQIIDVAIGARRRTHHCDFARELVRAAETIDLAHIRAAENLQDLAITFRTRRRQLIALDIDSLAAAAPQNRALNRCHVVFPIRFPPRNRPKAFTLQSNLFGTSPPPQWNSARGIKNRFRP